MAAGINDKFKKVSADDSYAVATIVKTARTVGGGTTLEAFDLSKWADATAVNFLTYRRTTDPVTNVTTVANRTGWTALVNTGSNTLTNLTVAPGYTDLGHQVGDYIEPVQMSKWANDLVDGILVSHNQNGSLKTLWTQYAPVNSGFSSMITNVGRYSRVGSIASVHLIAVGTSNSGYIGLQLPYPPKSNAFIPARVLNNSVLPDSPGMIEITAGSTTAVVYRSFSGGTFVASGEKALHPINFIYEIDE